MGNHCITMFYNIIIRLMLKIFLKTLHVLQNLVLYQAAEDIPPPVLIQLVTRYLVNLLVRIKEPSSPSGWQQSPQLQAEEAKKSRKLDCVATGFIYDDAVNFTVDIRPFVCRRHGFRSISQVSCGISISNFICMLMVAIGRGLLIFSDVTFKMAAWRPYWIFWFLDSNFTLALNINFKLQRHNTYVYG